MSRARGRMSSRTLQSLLSTIRRLPGEAGYLRGGRVQFRASRRSIVSVFSKRGGQNHESWRLGHLLGVAALAGSGISILNCLLRKDDESAFKSGISLLPRVQASEKKSEDGPKPKVSLRERRYKKFASVVYKGQPYMTPRDFIESLMQDEPRSKSFYPYL